jgi:hypothetical protein
MLKKFVRWFRRTQRQLRPDIVAVLCPDCLNMRPAYGKHYCPRPEIHIEIIEIGVMRGRHLFKRGETNE